MPDTHYLFNPSDVPDRGVVRQRSMPRWLRGLTSAVLIVGAFLASACGAAAPSRGNKQDCGRIENQWPRYEGVTCKNDILTHKATDKRGTYWTAFHDLRITPGFNLRTDTMVGDLHDPDDPERSGLPRSGVLVTGDLTQNISSAQMRLGDRNVGRLIKVDGKAAYVVDCTTELSDVPKGTYAFEVTGTVDGRKGTKLSYGSVSVTHKNGKGICGNLIVPKSLEDHSSSAEAQRRASRPVQRVESKSNSFSLRLAKATPGSIDVLVKPIGEGGLAFGALEKDGESGPPVPGEINGWTKVGSVTCERRTVGTIVAKPNDLDADPERKTFTVHPDDNGRCVVEFEGQPSRTIAAPAEHRPKVLTLGPVL